MEMTESVLLRIIDAWKSDPLNAEEFAQSFLENNSDVYLTAKQVAEAIRRTVPYATQSQPAPDRAETFSHYNMARGSLLWLDTAYFLTGYRRGPWYVLVAVDSFSRSVFYEPMRKITATSTAAAFGRILSRFSTKIGRIISDNGTEVHM